MVNIKDKLPRNFNIEKSDKERYKELQDEGIFEDTSHLDVFLTAMGLGWKYGTREELDEQWGLVNIPSISKKKAWTVAAIAVAEEESLNVLKDFTEVRRIADEYANGGFPLLIDIIEGDRPRNELKTLQKRLMDSI